MLYIKAILKNIYKNKIKNILNIFQLTISFLTIIILSGMIMNIKYKIDYVQDLVSLDTFKGYIGVQALNEEKDPTKYIFEIVPKYLNEIYAKQSENKNITIGRYQLTSIGKSNLLVIDNKLNELIKFKLFSGRDLIKEDFIPNDITPILISYDLKEKYPIGYKFILDSYPKITKYEVVGILDEDCKFWLYDDILLDKFNNYMIAPTNEFKDNYSYICRVSDNKNSKPIKNEIINTVASFNSSEFKIVNTINTIEELLKEKFKNDLLKIFFLSMFAIVLLILVLIGIRSLFKLQLLKRKAEFGIHISLGATTKDIIIIVIGEIIINLLLSFLLGFILVKILKPYIMISNSIIISLNIYIYSMIIITLITFVPVLFSLNKLIKSTPIELIRSNI